jgi:glycine cleavage system T protein (aminomethyltransferase)
MYNRGFRSRQVNDLDTVTRHSDARKTPIHQLHVALGARMMPFAGFDMPVQYSGIIDEHFAVRERAGIFDVSHMGEVIVTGPGAFAFVQHLVTNDASRLEDGKAMYTVMCRPDGGIVDDLLVYRLSEERYMLVINAANIRSDIEWMKSSNEVGANLDDISDSTGLLAVQGPAAFDIVQKLTPESLAELKFYHFIELEPGTFFDCQQAFISYTGYTGEKGLEIYCDADRTEAIWNSIMEMGKKFGLQPAGLGARDTLRLESGFCLYGNDLSLDTNPLEAGLGWLTKLDADDFIGRSALVEIKRNAPSRKLIGFVASERGIPRHDNQILNSGGDVVGIVTSGTQSPMLKKGIGMGYVENDTRYTDPGSELRIESRGKTFGVQVKRPPFHK